MDKGVWKETIRENTNKEGLRPCNRCKRRVHTKKRKGILTVKREERGGKKVCKGTVAKRIYPAVEVITNGASIFYREEGWEEANGAGLQISE